MVVRKPPPVNVALLLVSACWERDPRAQARPYEALIELKRVGALAGCVNGWARGCSREDL